MTQFLPKEAIFITQHFVYLWDQQFFLYYSSVSKNLQTEHFVNITISPVKICRILEQVKVETVTVPTGSLITLNTLLISLFYDFIIISPHSISVYNRGGGKNIRQSLLNRKVDRKLNFVYK